VLVLGAELAPFGLTKPSVLFRRMLCLAEHALLLRKSLAALLPRQVLAHALLSSACARTLAKLKVSLVLASAQLLVGPVCFAFGELWQR